jgi:acyl-CoA synthetase (NDP forming)
MVTKSRNVLTEVESKELLKKAGIPVVETRLARSKSEAISLSKELGFPVVLKIISPDVVHKSDAGGVKLGLANATQVGKAYREIMSTIKEKYPKAQIEGVSVQRMMPSAVEVIIGMSKDPQFGPVLMFGLGGVFVEILKDVSFRIVPVTNINALEDMIVKVSDFVEQNPQIKELDLNPVFAYPDKAVAVDARIILEE